MSEQLPLDQDINLDPDLPSLEAYDHLYGKPMPAEYMINVDDMRPDQRYDTIAMYSSLKGRKAHREAREIANRELIAKYLSTEHDAVVEPSEELLWARHMVSEKAQTPFTESDVSVADIDADTAILAAVAVDTFGETVQQEHGLEHSFATLASEQSHAIALHATQATLPSSHLEDVYTAHQLQAATLERESKIETVSEATLSGGQADRIADTLEADSALLPLDHTDRETLLFIEECLQMMKSRAPQPVQQLAAAEALEHFEELAPMSELLQLAG